MSVFEAIVLGIVQGVTEFIPVSSSGHLILVDSIMHGSSTFNFDALLNIGTLLALLVYFRHKLWDIATSVVRNKDWKLIINITISTIPAALIGYLLIGPLQSGALRSTWIVITMLLIGGVIMVFEHRYKPAKDLEIGNISKVKALIIGLAQTLALIPGTSRSGATIIAGRFSGLSHSASTEYSFLIAIPILSGAVLKTLVTGDITELVGAGNVTAIIAGVAAAAVAGYLAISVMLKYLRQHDLRTFGYYRIAVSLVLLITLL